jgi:hypothetical protein
MERRYIPKLALGAFVGAAAFAAVANAAPLPPISAQSGLAPQASQAVQPAVVTQNEVDRLKPEQVRWGHHWHHHHWHHHHWHRHHWHHRHWR